LDKRGNNDFVGSRGHVFHGVSCSKKIQIVFDRFCIRKVIAFGVLKTISVPVILMRIWK